MPLQNVRNKAGNGVEDKLFADTRCVQGVTRRQINRDGNAALLQLSQPANLKSTLPAITPQDATTPFRS
ncbi:hypothetical protein SAMN06265373_104212 [Shimia sagamensis]|uniref:Uncharacterized protein n=1 Tax=Shimia sagamensis TaxID=1566352 RepID=A0ABY1NZ88_9RHOB|nr:hypothetical protein SAMN06265373_104212 [Shimia sagamensis]